MPRMPRKVHRQQKGKLTEAKALLGGGREDVGTTKAALGQGCPPQRMLLPPRDV